MASIHPQVLEDSFLLSGLDLVFDSWNYLVVMQNSNSISPIELYEIVLDPILYPPFVHDHCHLLKIQGSSILMNETVQSRCVEARDAFGLSEGETEGDYSFSCR